MKIMALLRTLMLSKVGLTLTNESVCDIMQSTFRICYEYRLSDLLRKTAELALTDMIQLLFTRLPTFSCDNLPLMKKLKMRGSGPNQNEKKKKAKVHKKPAKTPPNPPPPPQPAPTELEPPPSASDHSFNVDSDVLARSPVGSVSDLSGISPEEKEETVQPIDIKLVTPKGTETLLEPEPVGKSVPTFSLRTTKFTFPLLDEHFVNEQGVTFDLEVPSPYGLPCVRELLRFLISLINPHETSGDSMIQVALSLLASALETGASHFHKFDSLLELVKDELPRNLISLLSVDRVSVFSSALWISYLLIVTQRKHLKYQIEVFLCRLIEVVDSARASYEHKELVLEMIVRLFKIPGFATQLYFNYDCDMFTHNLFEDLIKMLSQNAFPVTGLHSTHFLSLDALLTIVKVIEKQCDNGGQVDDKEDLTQTSREDLMALKSKKNVITSATEQFNNKPAKGIAYLQEMNMIATPLEANEVAKFIRENPHLDKKQIGEYISNRKHLEILEAFVNSFDFVGLRVDESLRQFLESFRLPGEAPVITLILEKFAEHYQVSNGNPFADADAAFTLAYAVIMLNVDQHNKNHTKTNEPMTIEQFKRNVSGTNGGGDHDQDMLTEIYFAIRNEEIVMPAEQTGLVKENYIWKCVLKRSKGGGSLLQPNVMFDHELFVLIWGPTIAALSYVFDKTSVEEPAAVGGPDMIERTMTGFQRCAAIAAHYRMSDVVDNLVISLAKFTTLQKKNLTPPRGHLFAAQFGANTKAMLATRMIFSLIHKHGDFIREGWKNVAECLIQLFNCQLLPKTLLEAEDFVDPSGRVLLFREEEIESKVESGFLNSFVSFISMSGGNGEGSLMKQRTPEEEEHAKSAQKCVKDSDVEFLVTESKFLIIESLQSFVKFLIEGSSRKNPEEEEGEEDNSNPAIFFEELLVRITIQNHDRVSAIWPSVSSHVSELILKNKPFLLERSVTALLRMAIRLARKEELTSMVVQSLNVLTTLKIASLFHICRHIAFGLHELLRNNAANIHESEDWAIIFLLIEIVGAGATPHYEQQGEEEDSGHGASSESDSSRATSPVATASTNRPSSAGSSADWIVLGGTSAAEQQYQAMTEGILVTYNPSSIVHQRAIVMHDSLAFLKSCESMAFLIRDVAHITPHNFGHCVQGLRTFVEASFMARPPEEPAKRQRSHAKPLHQTTPIRRIRSAPHKVSDVGTNNMSDQEEELEDNEDFTSEYHHVALQLLDLMHTLHTRAAQIYDSWPSVPNLWMSAWCPLLQGMARLCCDKRSHIRTSALTTLQRALLFHDLQTLSSTEWEGAFTSVLFPMLSHLLVRSKPGERSAMEETRTRAATLLGKVFLQHLTPLATLPTFTALWLTILDFMEKFIKAATSDLLADAVPESLKNMLLVMDTAGIFANSDKKSTPIWELTWDKLDGFLPHLMGDLFQDRSRTTLPATTEQRVAPKMEVVAPNDNSQQTSKVPEAQVEAEKAGKETNPSVQEQVSSEPSEAENSAQVVVPAPHTEGLTEETDKRAEETEKCTEETEKCAGDTNKPVQVQLVPEKPALFKEEPPVSPLDPPVVSASYFMPTPAKIELPEPTVVKLPSLPTIGPMPPIPPGIQANFQPIHTASPTETEIPLATPTPVMPAAAAASGLSSYFTDKGNN